MTHTKRETEQWPKQILITLIAVRPSINKIDRDGLDPGSRGQYWNQLMIRHSLKLTCKKASLTSEVRSIRFWGTWLIKNDHIMAIFWAFISGKNKLSITE